MTDLLEKVQTADHDDRFNIQPIIAICWVNEIGPYTGTVRSPTGIVVFEINADGTWSLVNA